MRMTFRQKLFMIVGVSVFALLTILIADRFIAGHVLHRISDIRDHYIPLVDLEPRLEAQFERIQRGFQDAVATKDLEALEKTDLLIQEFNVRLAMADEGVVSSVDSKSVRLAVEDYYNTAYQVSKRLIRSEEHTSELQSH